MLRTRLCDLLGIEAPIFAAPMACITGPELAAAVSNAGGLGILAGGISPPPLLRQEIRRTRELTDRPFAVNVLLPFPHEESVAICLEERVPALSFYWGDPTPYVERAHAAGVKVIHQVGTVAAAERAARAGVDVLIAQGVEAGGHLSGRVSTMVLAPLVVDAVAPTPVAVAGGVADARGLVAALALGAEAVVMGTRFLAATESSAHPVAKQKVVAATEEDTVSTTLFGHSWPNAPHRVIRTPFVEQWLGQEARGQESRPDEPVIGRTRIGGQDVPVPRFFGLPPSTEATGDIESIAHNAGQTVGLIHEVKPAGAIIQEMMEGAQQIIAERFGGSLTGAWR